MVKEKELISCRGVLWHLVFWGFAINYMLRLNLNLTIVAMVVPRAEGNAVAQCDFETLSNHTNSNHSKTASLAISKSDQQDQYKNRFAWNEYEQGLALGAFFWLHWLSQLPGGFLARRYGTKLVYGLGNFLTAVIGFFIPVLTQYHFYALIFLRVLQGLIAGVVWPSMHDMTAKWIPAHERSRFVSSYLGSSVGAAITYPLCAAISSEFSWGAAFYVTSLLGVIWYGFWWYLAYDSPEEHPRISNEEKKYILENTAASVDSLETKIPWKAILTSGPVWITIIAQWGGVWGFLTLMTQAPTYFSLVHGWNINTTGLLSGAPHLLRMVFSYYYSIMSDWLIRTKKMSSTNVRKLATFVAFGVQGIFILLLGFSGCYPILAIIFMMGGTTVNGAVSASTLSSLVDLSPNYASILLGFCGTIIIICGFLSPAVVGALTNNNQNIMQWRIVFIIAAVNCVVSTAVYLIYGTAEEQPWNKYGKPQKENGQEMQKLTTMPTVKCEGVNGRNDTTEKDGAIASK